MQGACFFLAVIAIASPILSATTYDCTTFDQQAAVAYAINNAGVIAGTVANQGFICDAQGNVTLVNYPGAASTTLTAVNNNGVAVGSYMPPASSTTPPPAGWFTVDSQGNFAPIQLPGPFSGMPEYVYGINDSGAISGVIEGMGRVPSMGDIGSPPQFFILSPQNIGHRQETQ